MTTPSRRQECLRNWCAIDNSCALYLLIKCSSKKSHTARVGSETAEVLREIGSSAYYDYVRTELNPGDYTTRRELLLDLIRTFNPEWLQADTDMIESDTWETRYAEAAKRKPGLSWDDRFGGKRLKISTSVDPPRHGYILL